MCEIETLDDDDCDGADDGDADDDGDDNNTILFHQKETRMTTNVQNEFKCCLRPQRTRVNIECSFLFG